MQARLLLHALPARLAPGHGHLGSVTVLAIPQGETGRLGVRFLQLGQLVAHDCMAA